MGIWSKPPHHWGIWSSSRWGFGHFHGFVSQGLLMDEMSIVWSRRCINVWLENLFWFEATTLSREFMKSVLKLFAAIRQVKPAAETMPLGWCYFFGPANVGLPSFVRMDAIREKEVFLLERSARFRCKMCWQLILAHFPCMSASSPCERLLKVLSIFCFFICIAKVVM